MGSIYSVYKCVRRLVYSATPDHHGMHSPTADDNRLRIESLWTRSTRTEWFLNRHTPMSAVPSKPTTPLWPTSELGSPLRHCSDRGSRGRCLGLHGRDLHRSDRCNANSRGIIITSALNPVDHGGPRTPALDPVDHGPPNLVPYLIRSRATENRIESSSVSKDGGLDRNALFVRYIYRPNPWRGELRFRKYDK